MVKQQIKVVVRTRPTPDFASNNVMLDQQHDTVTVQIPKDEHGGHVNNQTETWKFKFDKLMHNASQENIFEYCCQEAVSTVVDGINSTVMCYGQTAAGKTFTMTGSTQNYKYRGLIPRAINTIFSEVGGRFDTQITVKVSYIEIYNELLFDLLGNVPPHEQTGSAISVQDDAKGDVHLKGMTMIQCRNEEEALNCLFEGEQNRTTADNILNKTSSRSHAIFTIHLESRSTIETSEKVIHSQLNLVDLAGNERTKKTGAEGLTLREAAYINRSLSYLEQVVVSSCDKKREHVPYRQCKLTNILKNSIGGNCKTILIANIYPESRHLEETISTLRFASRMKNVTNEATVNEALDQPLLIKKLEREIRDLKQELSLHDVLASKGGSAATGEPYTPEESFQIQQQSLSYLTGEVEDIDSLTSVRQANEFLHQMRNLFRKIKQENANLIAQDESVRSDKIGSADEQLKRRQTNKGDGAGELLNEGGFGLGMAPREAKPVTKIEISKEREEEIAKMQNYEDYSESQDEQAHEQEEQAMLQRMSRSRKQNKNPRQAVDKQVAFQEFKNIESESGMAHEQTIKNCRADLKHTRQQIRIVTEQCNQIKSDIDAIKDHLDQITQEKKAQNFKTSMSPGTSKGGFLDQEEDVEEEIIDEEELQKLKKMKELKRNYRDAFNQLKELKNEANFIQQAIDNAKTQLVNDFELWYSDNFAAESGTTPDSALGHYNETSTISAPARQKGNSPAKLIRDPAMDEDTMEPENNPGREGVDVDNDALAYIRARKNVLTLAAAKKVDGKL